MANGPDRPRRPNQPERGRQFTTATSPDGRLKARYRDRNVWLGAADGSDERAVTTDGSAASRVKYGTASWVYGEELSQRTRDVVVARTAASSRIYRFDESRVPRLLRDARPDAAADRRVDVEAFPKAGAPNPVVDLFIYDVASGPDGARRRPRAARPFDNSVVGHYVYHVEWSRDGRELLFFRTNRRQNVMEVAAANPATGACRVILREEWPTGWVISEPRMVFLADGTPLHLGIAAQRLEQLLSATISAAS